MKRPERLVFLPLGLVTLLLLLSGLPGAALIFAAVTGLFAVDFQRRTDRSRQEGPRSSRSDEPSTSAGIQNLDADYRLLGLDPGAGREEVRRVYKHLAAHFHPDTGAPLTQEQRQTAEEAFLRIRAAHDRILERLTGDRN